MSSLQTIGLVYDFVGILILGVPLVTVGAKTIIARSGTYWDANPNEVRRMLAERIDVGLGTVVLAAGFGMQIAGQHASMASIPPLVGASVLVALVVVLVVYMAWLRKLVLARQEARALQIIKQGKLAAEDDEDEST